MDAGRPARADASHVARRRLQSAPAHEVDLDEVELIDPYPAIEPSAQPASTAPLAIDVEPRGRETAGPRRAPFIVPISPTIPRRRGPGATVIAGVALAALLGGALALRVPRRVESRVGAPAPAAPPVTEAVSEPAPAPTPPDGASAPRAARSTPEIPEVDVARLPRSPIGTVIGSPGHRLWIDGNLAASWQAPVPCGSHVVQVGSAGTPRTVDVPCGDAVNVLP